MNRIVGTPNRFSGEVYGLYFVSDSGQHSIGFCPCHILAHTAVDANPKGQVI